MEKIGIITDSAADLLKGEYDPSLLKIVPLKIAFSNGEYKDGVTISPEETYRRMDEEIPKTSLPDGQDMLDAIDYFKENGFTHIIGLFISSGLSGTYNAFRNVCHDVKGIVIEAIDTKELSMAQGVNVLRSLNMIKEGKSFDEIVKEAKDFKNKINTYFVLDTLEYLIKGGRIGKVSGTIGQLLNIKPIIHVNEEGIYHTIEKSRGKKQSIIKLIEYIKKHHLDLKACNVHIVHGGVIKEGEEVKKQLEAIKTINSITIRQLTPSLSVHTGKGLIGLIVEEI